MTRLEMMRLGAGASQLWQAGWRVGQQRWPLAAAPSSATGSAGQPSGRRPRSRCGRATRRLPMTINMRRSSLALALLVRAHETEKESWSWEPSQRMLAVLPPRGKGREMTIDARAVQDSASSSSAAARASCLCEVAMAAGRQAMARSSCRGRASGCRRPGGGQPP